MRMISLIVHGRRDGLVMGGSLFALMGVVIMEMNKKSPSAQKFQMRIPVSVVGRQTANYTGMVVVSDLT